MSKEREEWSCDTHYDRAWDNCINHQKIKLENAEFRIKHLNEQLQIYKKVEAARNDAVEYLKHRHEKTKEELAKCIEDKNTLKEESKLLKSSLLEIEHKSVALEESYDRNVTFLNLKKSELNQAIQVQVASTAQITAAFAPALNKLKDEILQKCEEEAKLKNEFQQLQQNFKQKIDEIKKLREEQFTTQKSELEAIRSENVQKNEELINIRKEKLEAEYAKKLAVEAMRIENLLRDEQLVKIQNEKSQMEMAKQNEIRELNAKLSEVQRVLGQQQQMEEVLPITMGHFNHEEHPRHTIVPLNNTTAIGESSPQSNIRPSEHVTANDIPIVSQSSSQNVTNRSNIVNDDPNSSDWNILDFRPDFDLPETSESEKNFC